MKTPVEILRTPTGADILIGGDLRATFVGDLDDPVDKAALDELVGELFRRAN